MIINLHTHTGTFMTNILLTYGLFTMYSYIYTLYINMAGIGDILCTKYISTVFSLFCKTN